MTLLECNILWWSTRLTFPRTSERPPVARMPIFLAGCLVAVITSMQSAPNKLEYNEYVRSWRSAIRVHENLACVQCQHGGLAYHLVQRISAPLDLFAQGLFLLDGSTFTERLFWQPIQTLAIWSMALPLSSLLANGWREKPLLPIASCVYCYYIIVEEAQMRVECLDRVE